MCFAHKTLHVAAAWWTTSLKRLAQYLFMVLGPKKYDSQVKSNGSLILIPSTSWGPFSVNWIYPPSQICPRQVLRGEHLERWLACCSFGTEGKWWWKNNVRLCNISCRGWCATSGTGHAMKWYACSEQWIQLLTGIVVCLSLTWWC